MPEKFIRDYRPEDFDAVTILWRVAREKSLPDFQRCKGHFFYEDQDCFRTHILQEDQVWVVEMDEHPVVFLAMRDDLIDHAQQVSPEHLWLYTLQSTA